MGASQPATVAAVIVHFRTPAPLRACLDALDGQTHACAQIVVVDNSCEPDALEGLRLGGHGLLRQPASNLGFGAACNLGARETDSDYLLFMNADVFLSPDACERLCETAGRDRRVAVVGPRIYGEDGAVELSARAFPSLRTGILGRSSLLTRVLRGAGVVPREMAGALAGGSATVDWVSGACMLIRRRAFEQAGGFDEGYWMYWEDADICRRLRDVGWKTAFCAEAEARHLTGSSGRSDRTISAFHESAGRYYERHVATGPVAVRLARAALRLRACLMRRNLTRRKDEDRS